MPPIDYSSDEDLAFEHGHRGKNPTSRRTPESDPDEVMLSDAAPPRTKTTKLKLATGEGDDEDLGDAMVHDGKDEGGNDKDDKDGGEADGADEDEDMASEEYVVEDILDHRFEPNGVCYYYVKWKGYEKKSDRTWEPVAHLEAGASDILKAYYKRIGGVPVFQAGSRKARLSKTETPPASRAKSDRTRKTNDSKMSTPTTATKASASKSASKHTANSVWKAPSGNWEDEIQAVDTIEKDGNGLHVYLKWNDGRKTKHPIEQTYVKCPQKMLHFYENHLVFKEGDGKAIAENDDN